MIYDGGFTLFSMDYQYVPHKAVAEVSKIGSEIYKTGW